MSAAPTTQRGLSLIELMIALLIGTILMLGLVQVFSASRTAYQTSEGMSRVQENARFALDFIQRDLRMAGHFGCVNDQAHLQSAGSLQAHFGAQMLHQPLDFSASITAFEAPGTAPGDTSIISEATAWGSLPSPLDALSPAPVPGSDILMLRYLDGRGVPVTNIALSGSTETLTLAEDRWEALTSGGRSDPGIYGIADCSHVDVFAAASTGGPGAAVLTVVQPASGGATNLRGRYTPQPSGQTLVYRAESVVFYVGQGAGGRPSLYRAHHDGTSYVEEELVEGIESLQLIFGLDRETDLTSNQPTGYIDTYAVADTAWTTAQWRRVGMVQVGVLAASPDPAASEQAAEREVLGVQFQAPDQNDGLFRSSYEVSVALRNRLYGN